MPLRPILKSMLDQVDGSYSAMLMGYDCIAIDEMNQGNPGFDVQMMTIEYATVIKDIRRSIEVIGAGAMEEMTITTRDSCMIVRMVSPELFAAFVMSKEGNLGKARYVLRSNAMALMKAIE